MQLNSHSTIENNTGIESHNYSMQQTPHFFKILSSSLYEDKVKAVLRELSANALDAHIEAGIEDTPIQIQLPNDLSPELVITDFGKGMSKSTLGHVYTSYGASTKTDNNDEVGGFGLGSKSPFALTQSFTVESTHNGITTHIASYLDEGMPKFSVFSSQPTDQPNGTTVRVPVSDKEHIQNFAHRASTLFLLWETPPEIKGAVLKNTLNDTKLHEQSSYLALYDKPLENNRYSFATALNYVAIGPFYYSIPTTMLETLRENEYFQFLTKLRVANKKFTFLPKFHIGELELAPSRERIEVTKENEQRILDRVATIAKEIQSSANHETDVIIDKLLETFSKNAIKSSSYNTTKKYENEYLTSDVKPLVDTFNSMIGCQDNPIAREYHLQKFNCSEDIVNYCLKNNKVAKLKEIAQYADQKLIPFYKFPYVTQYDQAALDSDKNAAPKLLKHFTSEPSYGSHRRIAFNLPKIGNMLSGHNFVQDVSRNLNTYQIEWLNQDKLKHSYSFNRTSANEGNPLLAESKFLILEGYKDASNTTKIHKSIKQGFLHPDTIVVYTKDHSVQEVKDDLVKLRKHYSDLVEKKATYLFKDDLLEAYKNVKHEKTKRTTKSKVPDSERLFGRVLTESSRKVTLEDVYSKSLFSDTKLLVVLPSNSDVTYSEMQDMQRHFDKSLLVVQLVNNQELNTKRFKSLVKELEAAKCKVHVTSRSFYIRRDVIEPLLSIKGLDKKQFKSYYTNMMFKKVLCTSITSSMGYSHERITKQMLSDVYQKDYDSINIDYPNFMEMYNEEDFKRKLTKELRGKLSPRTTLLLQAYTPYPNCDTYKFTDVFTEKERKHLLKLFNQLKKQLGDYHDSSYENIYGLNSNQT